MYTVALRLDFLASRFYREGSLCGDGTAILESLAVPGIRGDEYGVGSMSCLEFKLYTLKKVF